MPRARSTCERRAEPHARRGAAAPQYPNTGTPDDSVRIEGDSIVSDPSLAAISKQVRSAVDDLDCCCAVSSRLDGNVLYPVHGHGIESVAAYARPENGWLAAGRGIDAIRVYPDLSLSRDRVPGLTPSDRGALRFMVLVPVICEAGQRLGLLLADSVPRAQLSPARLYALSTQAFQLARHYRWRSVQQSRSGYGGQLNDRLRLLESIVGHAKDAVLITEARLIDPPGPRIVYCNPAFTRTTGYAEAEVLGRCVMSEACRQMVRWGAAAADLKLFVNVSAREIRDHRFLGQVDEALAASGLAPSRLQLEITENVFIQDPGRVTEVLEALRGRGIRLVLDDFGAGYSSLRYLDRYPIDALKLDREFVTRMSVAWRTRVIVGSILSLGTALGLDIIVEGIETADQRELLVELGCPLGQGFLLAPPMSSEAFAEQLARNRGARCRPGLA